jgi:phage-related minor tail protein
MNKELSVLGVTMSILLFAITTSSVTAQNATTNITNAAGNATKTANATMSEVGKNVTNVAGDAAKTASGALNKTGEAVNATVSEVGKNASTEGSSLLNQTEEVGKKIIGGAADVLGNISGEMKKP